MNISTVTAAPKTVTAVADGIEDGGSVLVTSHSGYGAALYVGTTSAVDEQSGFRLRNAGGVHLPLGLNDTLHVYNPDSAAVEVSTVVLGANDSGGLLS